MARSRSRRSFSLKQGYTEHNESKTKVKDEELRWRSEL